MGVGYKAMAQSIPMQEVTNDGALRRTASAPPRTGWKTPQPSQPSVLRSAVSVLKPPQTSGGLKATVAESPEALAALAADVRLAQSGDEQAMTNLIENNRAWVRGIAYTVLGDPHLA